jgi:hypothetical protein
MPDWERELLAKQEADARAEAATVAEDTHGAEAADAAQTSQDPILESETAGLKSPSEVSN